MSLRSRFMASGHESRYLRKNLILRHTLFSTIGHVGLDCYNMSSRITIFYPTYSTSSEGLVHSELSFPFVFHSNTAMVSRTSNLGKLLGNLSLHLLGLSVQ